MNITENAKNQINEIINKAYEKAQKEGALPSGAPLAGQVEVPRDPSHGDYAATHAMAAAKAMRMPPRAIAEKLAENINLDGTFFESVKVAGGGFINFTVSEIWYAKALDIVDEMGEDYGTVNIGNGKRVMVEFVSANPTGPMTVGNARGGALGDALAGVLSKAGYNVWREFLLNDTGNQVDLFGKSIDARYMQLCLGEENVQFPDDGYHGDDIRALAQKIYDTDADSLLSLPQQERIQKFIDFGLSHNIALMKEHLERYRIKFDQWFSESEMHKSGFVENTVELLGKAGLLYEKDGATWLKNIELGGEKDEVIRRANGFFTYYAVDIAYHRNKLERGFDKAIDLWGADHHGHSKRLMATMTSPRLCAALGVDGNKLHFLLMQMMRIIRDGETIKISKRTGKALTLNDLLDEIPVDACRFFFNARPDSQVDFDLELAVRQDSENPVYYVQYAHARICSLIKALADEGLLVLPIREIDTNLLRHETEKELIRQISLLPEEITLAARDCDPSRINKYVIELASRFHKFYNSCRIKGEQNELALSRLKLAAATRQVIKICLELLGVSALEKM
ncbi:MAG: arginine--tRNA ligase [Oscillospiraceae bacterium]|nr:arginine--tRNA ligase [Oscillospiraceae bacterium]